MTTGLIRGCTIVVMLLLAGQLLRAQDTEQRRTRAREFHRRAQQRTGLLVPLYVYPADIHQNDSYNRLMALKRRYETVPIWVILNPASGPGQLADANYTKAIDRLLGSGCVVLGYVTTSYAKRPAAEVHAEVLAWQKLYPRIQGVFFDEMIYEDTPEAVEHQRVLSEQARAAGCWPIVANPGADTPARYFEADVADVIVVHEGSAWPEETRLHGDYFGGYADYPPFTRAVLVHSQREFAPRQLDMLRRYSRWVYVTDDPYSPNDPRADNPWDTLSRHMEALCQQLAR